VLGATCCCTCCRLRNQIRLLPLIGWPCFQKQRCFFTLVLPPQSLAMSCYVVCSCTVSNAHLDVMSAVLPVVTSKLAVLLFKACQNKSSYRTQASIIAAQRQNNADVFSQLHGSARRVLYAESSYVVRSYLLKCLSPWHCHSHALIALHTAHLEWQ
jgi:hypothetical protein